MADQKFREEIWEINSVKRIVQIWPMDHPWQERPASAQLIGGVGWVVVQKEPPHEHDAPHSQPAESTRPSSG